MKYIFILLVSCMCNRLLAEERESPSWVWSCVEDDVLVIKGNVITNSKKEVVRGGVFLNDHAMLKLLPPVDREFYRYGNEFEIVKFSIDKISYQSSSLNVDVNNKFVWVVIPLIKVKKIDGSISYKKPILKGFELYVLKKINYGGFSLFIYDDAIRKDELAKAEELFLQMKKDSVGRVDSLLRLYNAGRNK